MLRLYQWMLMAICLASCAAYARAVWAADPAPPVTDASRWMEQLSPHIGKRTLRQIIIPGAHDAATAAISPNSDVATGSLGAFPLIEALPMAEARFFIAAWSRAQDLSLGQQLTLGVRYFDLRVAKREIDGQLYFFHTMYAGPVAQGIDEVADFLRERPKEIVILHFQHFSPDGLPSNITESDQRRLAAMLDAAFGTALIGPPVKENVSSPKETFKTLKELWDEKKQVVIIYSDESGGEAILNSHPNYWRAKKLRNTWINKEDVDELHGGLETDLKAALDDETQRPERKLILLQGVLTPGKNTFAKALLFSRGLPFSGGFSAEAERFNLDFSYLDPRKPVTVVEGWAEPITVKLPTPPVVDPGTFISDPGQVIEKLKNGSLTDPSTIFPPFSHFLPKSPVVLPPFLVKLVPEVRQLLERLLPFDFPALSLQELAERNNPQIISWFTNDWRPRGLNILMIDFVESDGFVPKIIEMNRLPDHELFSGQPANQPSGQSTKGSGTVSTPGQNGTPAAKPAGKSYEDSCTTTLFDSCEPRVLRGGIRCWFRSR